MAELVAISYSGGTQSECLVRMVASGELPTPAPVAVVFADPGMEHAGTYSAVTRVEALCSETGIPFLRAQGPNLFRDLLAIPGQRPTRLDMPPVYFRLNGGGRGRAAQRCTRQYKLRPIRRALRAHMRERGIAARAGAVVSWIGFTADEQARATKAVAHQDVAWQRIDFPLIRLGMTKASVLRWYAEHQLTPPPRSMCVACPAKSPAMWRATTAEDLERAVRVDEAVRDLTCMDFDNDAFLSDELIPVSDLVRRPVPPEAEQLELPGCDSGGCFL